MQGRKSRTHVGASGAVGFFWGTSWGFRVLGAIVFLWGFLGYQEGDQETSA